MDLSTRWLGFELPNPFVAGASPLTDDLDGVRRLEDGGISALVLRSLFEEQVRSDDPDVLSVAAVHGPGSEAGAAARKEWFWFGPDAYLDLLRRTKEAVDLPVIASINGHTPGGWIDYARQVEGAGADAIELNLYDVVTDPDVTGAQIESAAVEVVAAVRAQVGVPLNVKLSPFYSSLPHMAARLVAAGADGLTLFNRFYQPDIDVEGLRARRRLDLSTSGELLLRLNWLAILSGTVQTSYSVSGGVHTHIDALKSVMAGADAVQLVSTLLLRGAGHVDRMAEELARWLDAHHHSSLGQVRGAMNLARTPQPHAFERIHYMRLLQTWGG